jgi:hypothetical protein
MKYNIGLIGNRQICYQEDKVPADFIADSDHDERYLCCKRLVSVYINFHHIWYIYFTMTLTFDLENCYPVGISMNPNLSI